MSKMNCSEKSNLLSKLFLIIWVAVLLSGPVSVMLLIYFFANSIPKITMILLMIFITNPVGSHAIFKGAYRAGFRPDKKMEVDDFRRDFDE